MVSRREFLAAGVSAPLAAARPKGLLLGVMDGVVRQSGKPAALSEARRAGFRALQVTIGRPGRDGKLPLEDPLLQARYVAEARSQGVAMDATYLDVLHADCLKSDAQAAVWVRQGIAITRHLRARVLMTVFFGKCALTSPREIDTVAGRFKELAREAERADVILGFENLLPAEENARVLDRVGSDAFKVYYDAGNATNLVGADAAKEIRFLGRDRICQFHFKDQGYLGDGKVDYPRVYEAIAAIGFHGYANLETSAPSGNWQADLRRNLDYLNRLP